MTGASPIAVCGRCGVQMDPSRAVYDRSGTLVCPSCAARDQIAEGDARAVSSIVGTAIGVIAGGVLSWTCVNAFYIVSLITLLSAVGWLTMIARAPAHRTKMGGKFIPCMIAVCLGLVLAAMPLVFLAIGITATVIGR